MARVRVDGVLLCAVHCSDYHAAQHSQYDIFVIHFHLLAHSYEDERCSSLCVKILDHYRVVLGFSTNIALHISIRPVFSVAQIDISDQRL